MYICCALVGAIKDSVSQNAQCNSENYMVFYPKWTYSALVWPKWAK